MSLHKLILHVRKAYFEQIKSGEKTEEYRRVTPYWISRIEKQASRFRGVVIVCGYASWGKEPGKAITFPWNGYVIRKICHPEFGQNPVEVFAIKLEGKIP